MTYVIADFEVATAIGNEMLTKKNTLFDLDPKVKGVKVAQNVDQYPRLHVIYVPAKFDVATSHG